MKTNKALLFTLALLASTSALNMQAATEAETAKEWIKKNTPRTTGNNFYFKNDTKTTYTIDTSSMGGKAEYKVRFQLEEGQDKKVPTIGRKEYKGNESVNLLDPKGLNKRGTINKISFELINPTSNDFNLYHVIKIHNKKPTIFSYDKDGNVATKVIDFNF